MLAPLSWLKEYVAITLDPKNLGERLTEVGLGTEKITKVGNDYIFELEITPNRPDLLSIVGVAREIAAIEGKKIKLTRQDIPKPTKKLPFKIHNDFTLLEHYTNVIIADVVIKESPKWLQERIIQLGHRPINNVVDITNYVMFELGIPLHAFDYDEIHGKEFFVEKSLGGEKFVSVDDLSYILPKDAIIIKDTERVIDLVGIKGGLNTGIKQTTKNVLLQTSVDNAALIRRASQSLALRSDASGILERGIDKNGLIPALSRAANLILQLAGGTIASEVMDLKKKDFGPWQLTLRLTTLHDRLGITIPDKKIVQILTDLNLSPKLTKDVVVCTIPTYRNDLKIEEDLIEEVARLYGYNNFPKTLPEGQIPTVIIPYYKDYGIDRTIKQVLQASGFTEIYTYSLISENDLNSIAINPDNTLRVDNPVSRDYEYLRPTLKSNLFKALKQNIPYSTTINLFEIGKVYTGKNLKEAEEHYELAGITNEKNFLQVKGLLEKVCKDLGREEDPTSFIEITEDSIFFAINLTKLLEKPQAEKVYRPIPKYPAIMEDISLHIKPEVKIGDIIKEIKKQSKLITDVTLLDVYGQTKTFHIVYQDPEKNLTTPEVKEIREKIQVVLEEKFNAKLKE